MNSAHKAAAASSSRSAQAGTDVFPDQVLAQKTKKMDRILSYRNGWNFAMDFCEVTFFVHSTLVLNHEPSCAQRAPPIH